MGSNEAPSGSGGAPGEVLRIRVACEGPDCNALLEVNITLLCCRRHEL